MMLRSQHGVFHAGTARRPCPSRRVEQIGIEVVEIRLVLLVGQPFMVFHPLMPRRQRVKPPMNEQTETSVPKLGDRLPLSIHQSIPSTPPATNTCGANPNARSAAKTRSYTIYGPVLVTALSRTC